MRDSRQVVFFFLCNPGVSQECVSQCIYIILLLLDTIGGACKHLSSNRTREPGNSDYYSDYSKWRTRVYMHLSLRASLCLEQKTETTCWDNSPLSGWRLNEFMVLLLHLELNLDPMLHHIPTRFYPCFYIHYSEWMLFTTQFISTQKEIGLCHSIV